MEYGESESINDRGVLIDEKLVNNAIDISDKTTLILKNTLQKLTNLENPNSVMQLKNWLKEQGLEVEDLGKKNVQNIIKNAPSDLINLVQHPNLQLKNMRLLKTANVQIVE